MNSRIFSIDEAIRYGWQKMRENFWLFFGFLVVTGILLSIFNSQHFDKNGFHAAVEFNRSFFGWNRLGERSTTPLLWRIINNVVGMILALVTLKLSLLLLRNKKVTAVAFKPLTKVALSYIVATILFDAIIVIGVILLVVPGIIFAIRLQFYSYFIVEHGDSIPQAFQKSWDITRGNGLSLFSFGIISVLLIVIGALCFVVGLFFTVPTVRMAHAYVYDKLAGHKGHHAKD